MGAELARVGELQEVLQSARQSRAGAVDVASEGSPPLESSEFPIPDPSRVPLEVHDGTTAEPAEVRSQPLAPIPEDQPLVGPGAGHPLRQISPFPLTVARARDSIARSIRSNSSLEEPGVEPAPEGQPDKRRRTSSSTDLSSEGVGRVQRQVSQIEEAQAEREQAELEKIAEKELRRLDRLERLESRRVTARSSASDARASTDPPSSTPIQPMQLTQDEAESTALFFDLDRNNLFSLKVCSEETGSFLAKPINTRNSEFDMKKATPEELAGFKVSDALEWKTIDDLGAVQVLTGQEAIETRRKFHDRILSSRMIRRKKPMPGVGNWKFKSRWCLHGHHDPDGGTFKTFSPMPSSEAINLFFQLVLNLGFKIAYADVQSAFCQAKPLERPNGPLYAEPCPGLNLPDGALIRVVAPIYGLDDAPWRWHETLQEFFADLGFRPCLLESCWLVKEEHGVILAFVLIEVDDLNIAANEKYCVFLKEKLCNRFKFGKWEFGEADFAGRHVKFEEKRVLMNQEKYILEKLHVVKAPRGLLAKKEAILGGELFEEYRSMLYRVNWLAHQTRPEASGAVSILSSRLNKASVYDLGCMNRMVIHIKSTASQPLVLHKFDNSKMVFIAASDAGGVGSKPIIEDQHEVSDTVQGAWIVFASDQFPSANNKVRISTLSWRSSKLKRKVSSTLASEALAFSQALSEIEWLQVMVRDVLHGDINRTDWSGQIRPYLAVLNGQGELRGRLDQCAITDAKSLFDSILKESSSSRQDRRTAIELAIILEAVKRSKSVVRWSPHPRMVADTLTKEDISRSNGALEEALRTSKLCLWDEDAELKRRQQSPAARLRSKSAASSFREDAVSLLCLVNKDYRELLNMYHLTDV